MINLALCWLYFVLSNSQNLLLYGNVSAKSGYTTPQERSLSILSPSIYCQLTGWLIQNNSGMNFGSFSENIYMICTGVDVVIQEERPLLVSDGFHLNISFPFTFL